MRMKTILKTGFLTVVVVSILTGCGKLYEEEIEERYPRPNYDVDVPINPPWDSIPQPENPTGK